MLNKIIEIQTKITNKYDFIKSIIFYSLITFFCNCNVLPNNYEKNLIGSWESDEKIQISTGVEIKKSIMIFNIDQSFSLIENHPISGETIINYIYIVGYYAPKPAFMLLDLVTKKSIQSPIFFMLSDNSQTLTTSSNANMSLARIWKKQ